LSSDQRVGGSTSPSAHRPTINAQDGRSNNDDLLHH
jgi:hypothetical protein